MINVCMLISEFEKPEEIADELIFSIAEGNREALKVVYEKTVTALYAYVLSLTKNKYDTEDVLQETYVSIAENASSYRDGIGEANMLLLQNAWKYTDLALLK